MTYVLTVNRRPNGNRNKIYSEDRLANDWYRFVLAFPPHLAKKYIQRFQLTSSSLVLDPFCGTGTVLVECKKLGIPSIGIESNPMAALAARTKTSWSISPADLKAHAATIAANATQSFEHDGLAFQDASTKLVSSNVLKQLDPDAQRVLIKNSISLLPLHRILVLKEAIIDHYDERFYSYDMVALARTAVACSNLHFASEVGARGSKADADVVGMWAKTIERTADDIAVLRAATAPALVRLGDARAMTSLLEPHSVTAVITSPPYPNEKDYSRITRLELVLLGFLRSRRELRHLKQPFLRSSTRNIFRSDTDDLWVADDKRIQRIAREIERRRIALGKTSGFERLYATVIKMYFGGLARHLSQLTTYLAPGAQLAYVVGEQESFLRVRIRTGTILSNIATTLGYEAEGIDLFRTRRSSVTGKLLREEVVRLRWPGSE